MTVLTPRALVILRHLASLPEGHEDADIMVEGWKCYCGPEPIHRSTVNSLIRATAISPAYDGGPYYVINDTGRAIARRPELADEVYAAIIGGKGAFTIIDDKLVPMENRC